MDLAALLIPIDETFAYQEVRNEPLVVVLLYAHSLSRRKRMNLRSGGFAIHPL